MDALSADEALLLSRELPHLNTLIRGDLPGVDREISRRLALGVLTIAQGHPKLLELADGQAADPGRLAELVEAGGLGAWTRAVAEGLPPGERTLFWFLCCLEEPDRDRHVLDGNWDRLWTRLELDGQPPALNLALTAIATRGLVAVRPETGNEDASYAVHPGVAAAGPPRR